MRKKYEKQVLTWMGGCGKVNEYVSTELASRVSTLTL